MFKKSLKKGGLFMDGKKEKCGGARKKNVQRVIKYVDVNQKKICKGSSKTCSIKKRSKSGGGKMKKLVTVQN